MCDYKSAPWFFMWWIRGKCSSYSSKYGICLRYQTLICTNLPLVKIQIIHYHKWCWKYLAPRGIHVSIPLHVFHATRFNKTPYLSSFSSNEWNAIFWGPGSAHLDRFLDIIQSCRCVTSSPPIMIWVGWYTSRGNDIVDKWA
jgi:hypothetical protein